MMLPTNAITRHHIVFDDVFVWLLTSSFACCRTSTPLADGEGRWKSYSTSKQKPAMCEPSRFQES